MAKKQAGGKLVPLPITTFAESRARSQGDGLLFALPRASGG